MGKAIMVGMSEVHVAHATGDVLVALGLGSCLGVCAYDPRTRIAGMAHVVLPDSAGVRDEAAGKYADTGVPLLFERMSKAGAAVRRVSVALVGGAQLFSFTGGPGRLDIGQRNAEAVHQALDRLRIPVAVQDIGGGTGRTVRLHVDNGLVRVKTIGQGERDLAILGAAIDVGAKKAA